MPVDTGLPQEGMIYQRDQYAKGGMGRRYWDYRDDMALRYVTGQRVLDVGCGEGITLEKMLRRFPEKQVTGVDTEPENIAICQAHHLPVLAASVYELPFSENSIDCVLFSEVIEHLEEPEQALQEIHRVLKPEGRVIIIFPNDLTFKISRLLLGMIKEAFYDPGHVKQWTPGEMQRVVSHLGFTVIAAHNLPFRMWSLSLHHLVVAKNSKNSYLS